MRFPLLRFALLALLVGATPLLHAQRERLTPDEIEHVDKTWPGTKKTSTGMRYLVLQPGDGRSPKVGERVAVIYTGTLLNGGKKFDENMDPHRPMTFRIGRGEVIDGWDQIVPLMKLNERRLVIVPASLAYGSRGRAPAIPRDATLVFDMQLIAINPD
jgi:FKBP-type peptidyl-prolyl cis-trans isomerase